MSGVTFNVTVEESHAVLKKVLPLMSQQQVPTIPQNYAVWYDFVCAGNAELVAELDERMARGMRFSPDACRQLFEKYFLHELKAQVGEIQEAMRQTMDSALDELDGMDRNLAGFGALLARATQTLAALPPPETLSALVAELSEETLATRERNAAAEASIQGMRAELDALRVEVDALTRDARQDAVTGVANRRAFDDGLQRMLRDVAGGAEVTGLAEVGDLADAADELCLVLVDVDRFSAFNATHGEAVGDQVLRFVAQEMDQCVKGRDLLARYQGGEFAMLLPATSYNGALMLAESIRAIIEAQVVETDDGRDIDDLTISLGVVQCRRDDDAGTLMDRARACLRQAKASGRNRVAGERDLRS